MMLGGCGHGDGPSVLGLVGMCGLGASGASLGDGPRGTGLGGRALGDGPREREDRPHVSII